MGSPHNIGAHLNPQTALRPVAQAAAAAYSVLGIEVDRQNANSMLWLVNSGAKTGAPTTVACDSKLQHRDSQSAGWVDMPTSQANSTTAISQITDELQDRAVKIDLTPYGRFIRSVTQVVFTGGTSPTLPIKQDFILDKFIET